MSLVNKTITVKLFRSWSSSRSVSRVRPCCLLHKQDSMTVNKTRTNAGRCQTYSCQCSWRPNVVVTTKHVSTHASKHVVFNQGHGAQGGALTHPQSQWCSYSYAGKQWACRLLLTAGMWVQALLMHTHTQVCDTVQLFGDRAAASPLRA